MPSQVGITFDYQSIIALIGGYTLHCSLRKSFQLATPFIRKDLGFSKVDIGLMSSNFSIAYGLSKLLSGILSDFISPKAMFCSSLLLCSVVFFSFSQVSTLSIICLCMFMNGLSLGLGPPSLAKLVMSNVSASNRGTVWSIISFAGNCSYMMSPFLLLQFLHHGWRFLFLCGGILNIIGAILAYCLITDIITTPGITKKNTDTIKDISSTSSSTSTSTPMVNSMFLQLSKIKSLFYIEDSRRIFTKKIIFLLIGDMFVAFTLTGIMNWLG
eukprot:gene13734-29209_t